MFYEQLRFYDRFSKMLSNHRIFFALFYLPLTNLTAALQKWRAQFDIFSKVVDTGKVNSGKTGALKNVHIFCFTF